MNGGYWTNCGTMRTIRTPNRRFCGRLPRVGRAAPTTMTAESSETPLDTYTLVDDRSASGITVPKAFESRRHVKNGLSKSDLIKSGIGARTCTNVLRIARER